MSLLRPKYNSFKLSNECNVSEWIASSWLSYNDNIRKLSKGVNVRGSMLLKSFLFNDKWRKLVSESNESASIDVKWLKLNFNMVKFDSSCLFTFCFLNMNSSFKVTILRGFLNFYCSSLSFSSLILLSICLIVHLLFNRFSICYSTV